MYLLPVTTYFDYLRASKKLTVAAGGTILLSYILGTFRNSDLRLAYVMPEVGNQLPGLDNQQVHPAVIPAGNIGSKELLSSPEAVPEPLTYQERFIVQDEEIPFATEQRIDTNLVPGQRRVISPGANGLKRNVMLLTVIGDQEIKREVVYAEVLSEPVNKVVATNPSIRLASRNSALPAGIMSRAEFTVEATAYTFTGSNTATGVPPRVGTVAVDPRVIPLGTNLYVEGYGYAVAGDTGGAIKGNRIDVFFNTFKECVNWGRRQVKVYILAQ